MQNASDFISTLLLLIFWNFNSTKPSNIKTAKYFKHYVYQNHKAFLSLRRAHWERIKMQIFSSVFPRIDRKWFCCVCIVTVLCIMCLCDQISFGGYNVIRIHIYIYIYTQNTWAPIYITAMPLSLDTFSTLSTVHRFLSEDFLLVFSSLVEVLSSFKIYTDIKNVIRKVFF